MGAMARHATLTGRNGAVFAFAFLCGSCSPSFELKPSGSGTEIQLKFYEPGLIWSSPAEPCVAVLSVAEETWPHRHPSRVIWQIRRSPGAPCVKLKSVEIGKVPSGFSEEINRLPLRIGRMYGAEARAEPFGAGSLPWFVCAGGPAIITWKNEQRLENPPSRCIR
jgi:hypothetical protein